MSVCKGKVVAVVVVVVVVVLTVVFDSRDFSLVTLTLVRVFCPVDMQKKTTIMSTEIMTKKIGIRDRALKMRLVPLASILVNETNFSTIIFQIKQVR